jgi:hypothetical protein
MASSSTDAPKQASAMKKTFTPASAVKQKCAQNFFSMKKANGGGSNSEKCNYKVSLLVDLDRH